MSYSVEGEKCPVCHGYMFDDEDIVFCPVCGQPHHRECYKAVGECAVAQYHGTDMQYQKPERPQKEEEQKEEPQPQVDFEDDEEFEQNRFGGFGGSGATFITNIDPYGGVSPNKVDTQSNIPAKEYKKCVMFNTARYIPKFFSIQKGSRASWNWASALFPHAWYFYRKCYGQGVLGFVLRLVGTVLSSFGTIQLFKHLGIDYATTGYAQIMANSTEITKAITTDGIALMNFLIAAAGMVIVLATHILSGIFGDAIYKKECARKITSLKQIEDSDEREGKTRRAYGINIYLGLAALMLFQIVADLILFGV